MDVTYTSAIAEVVEKLETGNPLPTLVPQKAWSSELTNALEAASVDELFEGESLKNTTFGEAIKSGLLLWNDALDESHNISQGLGDQTGSYWHGIMHRREPDYPNSKYWFGRVGTHPISQHSVNAPSNFSKKPRTHRTRSQKSDELLKHKKRGTLTGLLIGAKLPKATPIRT